MKNIKKIIGSALLATAFAATSVGTTFALFTDDAKTTINVESGILDISASAGGLKLYSADSEDTGKGTAGTITDGPFAGTYYYKEMTNNFANGGSAELSEGYDTLSITKMTPGDRVTFDVTLNKGTTNINYKYRINYAFTGSDKTLAKGLVTKMKIGSNEAETYAGLSSYTSSWVSALVTDALPVISFDIALPIEKGNEYQNKSGTFMLTIQAVQGNAITSDTDAYTSLLYEDINSNPVVATETASTPTVVTASATDVDVKATIPAETPQVTDGKTVKLVVSDLAVSELPESTSGTMSFDASLYVNDTKTTSFDKLITVEIELDKYLNITSLKHNSISMEAVNSIPETLTDAYNQKFYYDATTGKLTLWTNTFSPFEVTYAKMARNTMYGFYDSYVKDGHWVHEVTDRAEFKNIMKHINLRGSLSAADEFNGKETPVLPLADKTSVYLLKNDINFGGTELWGTIEDDVFKALFTGTLTAESQVTLSNIHATTQRKGTKGKSDDNVVTVLFDSANDATFENITLSDITIEGATSCYSGLFLTGNKNSAVTGDITFNHCIVESNCSINIFQNGSSFLPLARYYSHVNFNRCVNKANIITEEYGATGFVGNSTAGTVAFSFVECTNYGNMTAQYLASGFTGYATNGNNSVYMKDCYNYGNLTSTGIDNYRNAFFLNTNAGWYTSITVSGKLVNHGKMYVNSSTGVLNTSDYGDNYEYVNYGVGETKLQIYSDDTAENPVAKEDYYSTFVEVSNVGELTLSFDSDNNYVLKSSAFENVHHVVVTLSLHALRMNKETGLESPYIMGGETNYVISQQFNSLEQIETMRVSQVGYYVPSGAAAPTSSINYIFDRYLLNPATANPELEAYSNGYHARNNGNSYIVLTNEVAGPEYLAVCVWRNRVNYTVTAYDASGNVLARGATQYGWDNASSGYDSLLTAITL